MLCLCCASFWYTWVVAHSTISQLDAALACCMRNKAVAQRIHFQQQLKKIPARDAAAEGTTAHVGGYLLTNCAAFQSGASSAQKRATYHCSRSSSRFASTSASVWAATACTTPGRPAPY